MIKLFFLVLITPRDEGHLVYIHNNNIITVPCNGNTNTKAKVLASENITKHVQQLKWLKDA